MSDSLPNPNVQEDLNDFFSHEEFLAFFDFYLPGSGGKMHNGLCKIARPDQRGTVNYLSLTFVVDTPNAEAEVQTEKLLSKLDEKSLREHLPSLQSFTSVPASMRRAENYIHQMDLIFPNGEGVDVREAVPMIMFSLRKTTGLKTESPQWWDEESLSAPVPTEAEKANWSNRLKAIFTAIGKK